MTVFLLHDTPFFPNPELADPNGLLAIGGDLSIERLLTAYKMGIFPWYNEPPIMWWSPPKRPVIFPRLFNLSRSLYQTLKKNLYNVTFDKNFLGVILGCAKAPRKYSLGTWINKEIIDAYYKLHQLGYVHSIEVWYNGKLVGGLYGLSIGKAFFGESMFTMMNDASKVALACLVEFLIKENFYFIDCQISNDHLLRMGAVEIPRSVFLKILDESINKNFIIKKWVRNNEATSHTASFLKEKLIHRSKR